MKIFLAILIFFAPIFCIGQMKIEDIKIDEDVVQFVSEYGQKYSKDWRKVSFNDLNGMVFQNNRKKTDLFFLDSLTKRKWIKSDFNKDGKLDLIFSGRIYTQLAVLAFISNGDSIECNYLGNSISMYYPSGISELKINESIFLLLNSFVRNEMQYEIASSYKADTLIYKFGGFIELSKSHKNSIEFDSVIFKTLSPWMGLVEIPKMKILSNGSMILYRNSGTYLRDSALWINGIKETRVSKEVINDLKSILSYIDFWDLNADYETKYVYDLSTAITEVYYKGEMKRVRDYGWHGTYGLSLLYKKINEAKLMSLSKSAQ
jgi:hypothetical protein